MSHEEAVGHLAANAASARDAEQRSVGPPVPRASTRFFVWLRPEEAAMRLQRMARGWAARRWYAQQREAIAYEQWLRIYLSTKRYDIARKLGWPQPHHEHAAACRIQACRVGQLARRAYASRLAAERGACNSAWLPELLGGSLGALVESWLGGGVREGGTSDQTHARARPRPGLWP